MPALKPRHLAAALAVLAAAASQAQTMTAPATLTLTAEAKAAGTPDVADIGAGVVTQGAQAGAAMAENARRMTAVVAALRKAGIADRDIQTSALTLEPQYRYGDNQPPTLTGYQARNRVTVTLRDLPRAGRVIDALVAEGANQIDGPNFRIDKPEPLADQARRQAVADLRRRAQLYAEAAGLSVRRIIAISEGQAAEPPMPRPVMVQMAKAERADTPVAPGQSEIAVTVTMSFELQ